MRTSNPKPFSSALSSVIKEFGLGPKLKEYKAIELWPSIVGEHIAKVTVAERIDHGKLIVRVSRATWRNELVFLKQELMKRMNAAMNQEIVKDIIFR